MTTLMVAVTQASEPAVGGSSSAAIDFNRDVRPIFADTCYTCHGPDAAARDSQLRLDHKQSALADHGAGPAIVPGDAASSELIRRITSTDIDERMPPVDSGRQLSGPQIETLRRWIARGAEWPDGKHWAFQPPRRPPLPAVDEVSWPRNAIDYFILARQQRAALRPMPPADKTTLIRRLTFDLTGLPPTPAEVDAFLADESPGAYEALVDRLLASPRYGEHMARPWLDAARFADTDGYQNDRLRYMWAWRDWVVGALNQNMPFDQFTIEQIAGDMLPGATLRQQIASGFNRNHRINSEGGSIAAEFLVENVADRVETTATVWLGLTIGCARCHDHKYDPFAQREYYQLFAYFHNVPEWGLGPNDGNSPPFITLPENYPFLSDEENRAITPKPYEIKVTQGAVRRPKPGDRRTVMVMHEMKKPRDTYLLVRGAYDKPDTSEVVRPALPAAVCDAPQRYEPNRLGLAHWLVDGENPLTARVTINRYWQMFFGTGLVKTSENFGTQGEPPSHPRLLDYLASEFVDSGWDVKAMHRLIVTSAAYRQSSHVDPALAARDPENRLLARGPRVRLSAHVVRDQALAISGLLVERQGGPSVRPYMPPDIWKSITNRRYEQDHGEKLYRRSLYTYWKRTVPPPTMMTFGAAHRETCIVRTDLVVTPLQALTSMNNITFVEAARFLAQRMLSRADGRPQQRLDYAFRLATSRHPTPREAALLNQALDAFLERYENDIPAAEKLLSVGEKPRDSRFYPAELAAYTMVANLIMNLDETVTKE